MFTKQKNIIKTNGILIVRLDAIGDFFIWQHAALYYKKQYPNIKHTLIANKAWSEVAKKLNYWDEIIDIDINKFQNNYIYRFLFLKKSRITSYDLAINPVYSRNILLEDSLIRLVQSNSKICFDGDLSNITPNHKIISNKWYTELVQSDKKEKMELQRNFDLNKYLFKDNFDCRINNLPLLISKNQKKIEAKYIIIFPGGSWTGKQWEPWKFSIISDYLYNEYNLITVILGSKNEIHIANEVLKFIKSHNPYNYVGKTGLIEVIEIIRSAELLVTNDTSAVHIAFSTNTKSICILGGGHFGRFGPYENYPGRNTPLFIYKKLPCYNCNWHCIYQNNKNPVLCISDIKTIDVIDIINKNISFE